MALNKLKFNSINVTPVANQGLKFNSSADGFEAGAAGGAMTFISKQTASSSSTISFTSGIDSTYKEYIFHFNNIHPGTDSVSFDFNLSIDSGSNYNVTKTSSTFAAFHGEDGVETAVNYGTVQDLAQSTAFQKLTVLSSLGIENDESLSGTLHLFNPSNTTFVKHYIATTNFNSTSDFQMNSYIAGYGNTTSAVDAVQFKMSSGNIDAGTITLYGIN